MSFPNSESMYRYPEQMQHDDLLTEQDQKFITDFFNTLATEEPPSHMMDYTNNHNAPPASNLSFQDVAPIPVTRMYPGIGNGGVGGIVNGMGMGRGKKGHHELLTEAEKKANHIASEQKRRQNIRLGFDQLVEIVPTLSQCHRTVEYIQQLLMQKNELKDRVKSLQVTLGDPPDHVDDSSSDGELDLIF
ncbi:4805_t:CDS:2 [Entrophospora sp. SA101]|nr:4805_t:CDS:2 [Entrophospora sp. SA101]CAJ0836004.1 3401_t:CDS:2 [Entrophospora sp. SA101]CAJ0850478.1 9266_t:CDS:2 [Entrophospora sp. SA101]